MAETGVLRPDARVELLDGRIIDTSPIGPFHGGVTTYLTELFVAMSKGCWQTRVQNSLRVDEHSEPQPDVVLVKPTPEFYRKRHPQPEDVYLLIEISETTLETDQEEKLPLYGGHTRGVDSESQRTAHRDLSRAEFHRLRQQNHRPHERSSFSASLPRHGAERGGIVEAITVRTRTPPRQHSPP